MAKVISLFNHKGGVSKTTTVFHLGWKMASMGKKVLLVDADPQCNLTGLTLGLEDYDSLFDFYDSRQNTDIFNSLASMFAIESRTPSFTSARRGVAQTKNENLSILAGNIRFSEIDIQIATALTSSGTIPVLRPFVGAINKLIRDIAKQGGFDVVIVDMSPSVSATNHCILMGSDYFIIPISPDFYCYQAVDSLSNVLPRWRDEVVNFRRGRDEFSLPENSPRMLGFISKNEEDLRFKKVQKSVVQTLLPSLKKHQMLVEEGLFKQCVNSDTPYHLGEVQNPGTQKADKVYGNLAKSVLNMMAQDNAQTELFSRLKLRADEHPFAVKGKA